MKASIPKLAAASLVVGFLVNLLLLVIVTLNDSFMLTSNRYKIFRWGWPVTIDYPLYVEESHESWASAVGKFSIDSFVVGFILFALIGLLRFAWTMHNTSVKRKNGHPLA